ncbi:MAG: hypothetical protein HETSPECPRED_005251 [Heterodermia speciosa]|uniref:Lytic polysaccharide monooxygenase n=1 Tax=Heterodermia speciosa TaxID=116794 RepID=A0A8H3FBW7_9LECA|nr:MAG: hypothetical protein HETSPECPRED_005251 [Heterodermia speciosa]
MLYTKAFVVAAATYLATGVQAHMKLATPAPYGPDSLNNSPLDASGSDFPCKQRAGVYAAAKSTATMPIGAKQTLSFIGGATHGGGSCQISLTKDLEPTKDSVFQVIHSIEGGCPTSSAGNIGGDPNAADPTTFDYQIPQGIAPGKYTLAWTWFNKVGNREMYMNCAPIVVSGGGSKRSVDDDEYEPSYNETADFELAARDATFPSMFVANIPATDCTTLESADLAFPDPGPSVQKAGTGQLSPPTGPKCGANKAVAGGSAAGSASAASPSTAPTGAAGEAQAASPSAAVPGTATILASAAAASPSAAAATPAAGASTGSTASAGSTPCSSAGALVCSADGTKFGICTGTSAIMQAVAPGTKCTNGAIDRARRSAKFAREFSG